MLVLREMLMEGLCILDWMVNCLKKRTRPECDVKGGAPDSLYNRHDHFSFHKRFL